ncbi:MAG: acetylglutamate kinase, partial [Chloroflexota bacterium]|nr:acetylglutamate kinase [Chloroflexota bacterium]
MKILKIGGDQIADNAFLKLLASTIATDDAPTAIVHGGGNEIAELQKRLEMKVVHFEGLRVTDQASLEVAEMILSGTINKKVVSGLIAAGIDAIGISGIDRGLFRCTKKSHPSVDLGLVGEIHDVRPEVVYDLVHNNITPVISPISLGADGKHYNVNADEAAAALAVAVKATKLFFVSNVPGIIQDNNVITTLDPATAIELIEQKVIKSGMVPKILSAIQAVKEGVDQVRIVDGKGLSKDTGTTIISNGSGNKLPNTNKDTSDVVTAEAKYVVSTYSRPLPVFTHGKGVYLFDTEGRRYLDFTAGIAVTALGHSDKQWVEAVSRQAGKLTHVSNLYHTEPHVELAQQLTESSFADRVYFCNSGTEANEAAFKFARKWARANHHTNVKTRIVAFEGSFHGRTTGSLAATSKTKYRSPFEPLMPGIDFATLNDIASAEKTITNETCAVIVEPIQGEGGVNTASNDFLSELRKICDKNKALLIFDEVQCGLARTGHLWAYQNSGIRPDIMTLAKPLAGGLPIGATLVTEDVAQTIHPGDHGSTFAAGPLVCKAANVVFNRVSQPDFIANVASTGKYLKQRLLQLEPQQLVDVRGSGLLIGSEFSCAIDPLIQASAQRGLLLISAGENVLRLCPPLIVTMAQVDEALEIIGESLGSMENNQV